MFLQMQKISYEFQFAQNCKNASEVDFFKKKLDSVFEGIDLDLADNSQADNYSSQSRSTPLSAKSAPSLSLSPEVEEN